MIKKQIGFLSVLILLSACAGMKDPGLVKYEAYSAEVDQKAARGEVSQLEADNLKMQAYQEYRAARRLEEDRLMQDSVSRQIKSQNQEINSVLRQSR